MADGLAAKLAGIEAMKTYLMSALCALAISGSCAAGSLTLGPAIMLAEDITPGVADIDIFAGADFTFVVQNTDDAPQWYNFKVESPKAEKWGWEHGYEAIPSAEWCKLSMLEVEVKAKSEAKFRMTITVPDKEENWNRKWMALVVCAPGRTKKEASPAAVGLRVASRVMIETRAKDTVKNSAAKVAVWPTVLASSAIPGAVIDETVKIKNNSKEKRSYRTLRISEVEKDQQKFDRYVGKGFNRVTGESWLKSEPEFTLKPDEMKEFRADLLVPSSADKGKKFEELLFVVDDLGNANFVRFRVEIPPTTAQKP